MSEGERGLPGVSFEEGERLYRSLFYHMPNAIFTVDRSGSFIATNPAGGKLLGKSAEELWGMSFEPFVAPEDLERALGHFGAALGGASQSYEVGIVAAGGVRREGRLMIFPLMEGEEVVGVHAVIEDVTKRKRAEEEARAYGERLEQANRELQDFAYVASHDLQEPLRKIRAFGDRLEARHGDDLGDTGRDYLARMQNASARMQTLIEDLLSYSRVTTKAQPFSEVDLSAVARDVLVDLEARIEETGGRVEVGDLPAVQAEPFQMRQLLQNLIANALKFHREGVPPLVEVRSAPVANGVLELHVEDNGIGFEERYLDRIFVPFQRLHGRGIYEGTGIGTAICRKIAERHGGEITASSIPGEGSTFIVTLPVSQPEGET